MKLSNLIPICALALAAISCSQHDIAVGESEGDATALTITTRVTGAAALHGISEDEPYWGLYAYTMEGAPIFENAKMEQYDGDDGWSSDVYKASKFTDGKPEDVSSRGGMILSAYYPYRDEIVENNFDPASTDISPKMTINSLGHPSIHYGVPIYRIARHPKGGETGYFDYGEGANPRNSNIARDLLLFYCHKSVSPSDLRDNRPVKIELHPATCRIAFVFSLAPRYNYDGSYAAVQPDSTDYEIMSVRRLRHGHQEDATTYARTTFNYDIFTGNIIDKKFSSDGHHFEFPVKPGDPGYNPAWGPVNPYKYNTSNEAKLTCVEFVGVPSVYDDLQDIIFEVVYRFRVVKAADTPEADEDVWVESISRFNTTSTYLVDGWASGKVYRYHVYISRHEVDYEVEILPWEFDPDEDQFFGDIQV